MIGFISGTIQSKNNDEVVVMTNGGVGYLILTTPEIVARLRKDQTVSLYIYTRVTDSDMSLYGFQEKQQKDFFELLLSVSGVGPKSAMNILSIGSLQKTKDAIARGDVQYLTAVQGMGKKTSERLIVELKNKVDSLAQPKEQTSEEIGTILSEVIDALVGFGYSKEEAKAAVTNVDTKDKSTEVVLKEVLKEMK